MPFLNICRNLQFDDDIRKEVKGLCKQTNFSEQCIIKLSDYYITMV